MLVSICFIAGGLLSTYMLRHKGQTSFPLLDIEIFLAEPAVAIVIAAAPEGFRYVVVQVDDHALTRKFLADSIPDFQSRRILGELRVLLQDRVQDVGAIRAWNRVKDTLFESLVRAIRKVVIHHLDCKRHADGVEAELGKPRHDILDGRVLEAFGNHDLLVARPICRHEVEDIAIRVDYVSSLGRQRKYGSSPLQR